jgi:hypothetical protein
MSDLNIDWSKVTEPIQFFGLSETFEESELKKAYKSYIKVYKPDLHPEEFKKIRKAYESLLNRLAFNAYEKELETLENNLEPTKTTETVGPKIIEDEFKDIASIKEFLDKAPLNAKSCLYWAAYSDMVKGERDHFYWLMKGVQYLDMHDYYYCSHLNLFVRSSKASDEWVIILQNLASNIKADVFYFFLHPVFSQLLKDLPTEKVISCLINCEKKLIYSGDYIQSKIDVYLMLLRKCVFEGKLNSIQHLFEFLNSQQSKLHDDQFSEFEFNQNLKEYFQKRGLYINQNKLCERVNQLIESFIGSDEENCRTLILEIKRTFKNDLVYDASFYSQEFNDFCKCLCKIVDYIIFDVGHILSIKNFNDRVIINNAVNFNEMIEKTYARSLTYQTFWFTRILFCSPPIFLIVIYAVLFSVFLIIGYFTLDKIKAFFSNWENKIDEKLYDKVFKRKVFEYIFQNNIMMDHISLLPQIYAEPKKIENTKKIYEKITKVYVYELHDLFAKVTNI